MRQPRCWEVMRIGQVKQEISIELDSRVGLRIYITACYPTHVSLTWTSGPHIYSLLNKVRWHVGFWFLECCSIPLPSLGTTCPSWHFLCLLKIFMLLKKKTQTKTLSSFTACRGSSRMMVICDWAMWYHMRNYI